jgi:thioesterase domain-containing protein
MLPNLAQHTIMLRQYARAFKPNELSADMTLFVAGELHPNHISQRWKLYLRGHLDMHTISTTHAELTSTDSFAEIGPIIARKLNQQALNEKRNR